MKLGNLQKIIILLPLISVVCFLGGLPAFGQGIELTNIHSSQSQIHVGDSITINATIVNDSPSTIYFNGGCLSPLSVTFDKNVQTGQAMGCFALFNANLKPGQNTTVVAPGSANLFTATSPGTTNANVTLSYNSGNQSQNTVSKLFTFDIFDSTSIPEFPSFSIVIFTLSLVVSIVFVSRKNNTLFKL